MRRSVHAAVLLSAILCSCSTHDPPEQRPSPSSCEAVADTTRQVVASSTAPVADDSVAAGDLVGSIIDAETGKPLLAQVTIPASARGVVSDSAGHFRIALPEGTTSVVVRRIGYVRATVAIPARSRSGLVTVVALRRALVCTDFGVRSSLGLS